MRRLGVGLMVLGLASAAFACSSGGQGTTTGTGGHGGHHGGTGGHVGTGGANSGGGGAATCTDAGATGSGIPHVIIVIQENHTFDNYFGTYCTAAPGSNPSCVAGPACCEAAPQKEPSGASPVVLDDTMSAAFSPNHLQNCEVLEIDKGKMDQFVAMGDAGAGCADPNNFAIAPDTVVAPYHAYAASYALADRYFQPLAGQSSSNDMYLAVAKEVFLDNSFKPDTVGKDCDLTPKTASYPGQTTIVDLLQKAGKKARWYAEGYGAMKAAAAGSCPKAPADCTFKIGVYPCVYAPSDVPFLYYAQHASDPSFMQDYAQLAKDLAGGTLPDVSYVKALGYHGEHPGQGVKITDGIKFVEALVTEVGKSCYANDTLILLTWDEGGGYFDHVAPPADSAVDHQPYGTRVPLLAIGRYARKGVVSHVEMEHSSIVKFLEFNYLGGKTGQLGARDAVVNNIGSLLDPQQTGVTIPDQ